MNTLEKFRSDFPNYAAQVTWEYDEFYRWDGDGPDPVNDDLYPHDVYVSVSTIRNGKLFTGEAHLGGCYEKWGETCPEVDGYLPQLLDEARQELERTLTDTQ